MMSREDAKRDAEKIWRLETDVTKTPAWSGASKFVTEIPDTMPPSNGDLYLDWTDNPHGAVERRVGEPDSKWLCANGHGPFDPPRIRVDGVPVTSLTPASDEPFEPVLVPRPEPDPVNHPSHYSDAGGHEPIKVIEAWDLGFHLGNTVKYISRAGKKDPNKRIEDLKKAAWYLARHIDNLENDR